MAITVNGASFIALALRRGANLGNLVTVGRQGLYAPKAVLNDILVQAGRHPGYGLPAGDPGYPQKGEWADDLYRYFGASELNILDGSAYEGAGVIQDLNVPLAPALANRFDCLIDGGSLEHVFNVPEALSSYMKMVKVGGHIILMDMPVTNLSGHGFYQFSPALFWQVFSEAYGFRIREIVVAEAKPFAEFWRVKSPADYGARVELVHDQPCHLYLVAEKCGEFPGFGTVAPIQHDYSQAWSREPAAVGARAGGQAVLSRILRIFTRVAPRLYWKITNARNASRQRARARLGGAQAPYARLP